MHNTHATPNRTHLGPRPWRQHCWQLQSAPEPVHQEHAAHKLISVEVTCTPQHTQACGLGGSPRSACASAAPSEALKTPSEALKQELYMLSVYCRAEQLAAQTRSSFKDSMSQPMTGLHPGHSTLTVVVSNPKPHCTPPLGCQKPDPHAVPATRSHMLTHQQSQPPAVPSTRFNTHLQSPPPGPTRVSAHPCPAPTE
jgi:hypothetical protein